MNFIKFALITISCSALLLGTVWGQFDNLPAFFNELQQSQPLINAARDPREDTGPVQFPQNLAGPAETSGVRAVASGFGFVPPNVARARSVLRK